MQSQLLRSLILDQAIASIEYTEAEHARLREKLLSDATHQTWQQQEGITPEQFEAWLRRELKIRKFQQQRWGKRLLSYFLQRKSDLDRVVCSLIYLRHTELAQELYFRIAEGEQSFAEVARRYSHGTEAQAGGIVGPIELGKLHPDLARMFYGSQPGQLWSPVAIDDWVIIARLEASLPVQLDDTMRQLLLNELLEAWLQDQLKQRFQDS
jgi:parvulin-like peptidyl-prolyl isomerase